MSTFVATTAVQTLAADNNARRMFSVFNNSGTSLYLKMGASCTSTEFTVKLVDGSLYELPWPIYTGPITAVFASSVAGSCQTTENY